MGPLLLWVELRHRHARDATLFLAGLSRSPANRSKVSSDAHMAYPPSPGTDGPYGIRRGQSGTVLTP